MCVSSKMFHFSINYYLLSRFSILISLTQFNLLLLCVQPIHNILWNIRASEKFILVMSIEKHIKVQCCQSSQRRREKWHTYIICLPTYVTERNVYRSYDG